MKLITLLGSRKREQQNLINYIDFYSRVTMLRFTKLFDKRM